MIKLIYAIPLLISSVFISTNVSASLIVSGNLTYDDESGVITSTSGKSYINWADLAHLTHQETVDQTLTGAYTGFHIASQTEAFEFFNAATQAGVTDLGSQQEYTAPLPSLAHPFGDAYLYRSNDSLVFFYSDSPSFDVGVIDYSLRLQNLHLRTDLHSSIADSDLYSHNALTIQNDISWLLVSNPVASPVPVPAAVWFMGSGLLGLMGYSRKRKFLAVAA